MGLSENAIKVLKRRYFTRNEAGEMTENAEGLFRRVAGAIVKADANYLNETELKQLEEEFYNLMYSTEFLPNSPTLMNAGRPLGQLSACFVLPVEDTMEGIFETIKNAALIHKSGGGTGFSFSRLRPSGASVNSTGGVASGPISFMKVFNAATEAVKQGGTRRGANMAILRVDHPDIMQFISCKSNSTEITNFNISVGVTESFMKAIETDSEYDLIDPHTKKPCGKLKASAVFNMIIEMSWKNGEPGIIFLDRLNRDNITPAIGAIESTNPCGEQPLLPYEACNLGSINMSLMLKGEPGKFEIDYEKLEKTVKLSVHFLDNVIDVNRYPLQQIDEMTKGTRKIGLGIMGWADMLLKLKIPYDSEEAIGLAETVMYFINGKSKEMTVKIAEKKGVFPYYNMSVFREKGLKYRNGTTTTIAPTGTLSIIADVSSGIEPLFAISYIRNVMDNDELIEVNPIFKDIAVARGFYSDELMKKIAQKGTLHGFEEVPEDIKKIFVTSHDISPEWHIKMQAAFQKYTDNAVSKTVNLKNNATKDDVREVFELAYKTNCKGVTIYRDGSRDMQVLNIGKVNKAEEKKDEATKMLEQDAGAGAKKGPVDTIDVVKAVAEAAAEAQVDVEKDHPNYNGAEDALEGELVKDTKTPATFRFAGNDILPRPRPEITTGFTEKVKIGCGSLFITVNYDENGICEVFTNVGRVGGCPSQSEATSRLVSIALRSGVNANEIVQQLKGIRCPSTVRQKDMKFTSCPDAIGRIIEKVLKLQNSYSVVEMTSEKAPVKCTTNCLQCDNRDTCKRTKPLEAIKIISTTQADNDDNPFTNGKPQKCPECGKKIEHESGCVVCHSCGYSKCG